LEISIQLLQDSKKGVAFIRDISERKRADRAIQESEARLKAITESMTDIIIQTDREGRVTYINRTAPGYEMEQVLNSSMFDIIPPERHEKLSDALKAVFERGENYRYETAALGGDRSLGHFEIHVSPIFAGGEVAFALFLVRDITERKQIEEERFKAERLEYIGHLADGIAHDFNNLLMGIMGCASLAKMELEDGETPTETLQTIEHSCERARDLTRQLLNFARGGARR